MKKIIAVIEKENIQETEKTLQSLELLNEVLLKNKEDIKDIKEIANKKNIPDYCYISNKNN